MHRENQRARKSRGQDKGGKHYQIGKYVTVVCGILSTCILINTFE